MKPTDEELVNRFLEGDQDSFNLLMWRWEKPLYQFIYRVIGDQEEAQDLCQESFLRAYRSLKGFRQRAKFSSWLYKIAINLCHSWGRKRKRARIVPLSEVAQYDRYSYREQGKGASSSPMEASLQRREKEVMVRQALACLTENQRLTIILKEYQGLKFREIAQLLRCPESTVKSRLYTGLVALSSILASPAKEKGESNPHPKRDAGSLKKGLDNFHC